MLHIACAGAPGGTPKPGGTLKGLEYAHSLGITAMELEWVQRVPMNHEHMQKIHSVSTDLEMYLTVHAPYYINLNAADPEKLEASKLRILHALEMAQFAGAHSVCVHPAFYLGQHPEDVLENVMKQVGEVMEHKATLFPDVNLGLETMGKVSQFGTLEEVLEISQEYNIYPVVDFAHIHARTNGRFNTEEDFKYALDVYARHLGADSLKKMHMHYSGIAYGLKGERHHLPFAESDANWQLLLTILKEAGVGGTLICESPLLEEDTLLLKHYYESL